MYYESKVLTCRTSYRGGCMDLNINDELRVFYHFDFDESPISIWAVKYDSRSNDPTYIVLLDKGRSDISNQKELNRMLSCCQGNTREDTSSPDIIHRVYMAIKIQVRNSKRSILKGMLNE